MAVKRDLLGHLPHVGPDGSYRTGYVRLGLPGDYVKVNLLKFDPSTIRVKDIARGLAKRCRYGGAVKGWYSVAEHSVLGSYCFTERLQQQQFLVHDAAEFVFEDVMSPVVQLVPEYKALRDEFQGELMLMYTGHYHPHPNIKRIDEWMYTQEQNNLRGVYDDNEYCRFSNYASLKDNPFLLPDKLESFHCWPYYTAEEKFLKRWEELFLAV